MDDQPRWTNEADVQSKCVCRGIHFPSHPNYLTRPQTCTSSPSDETDGKVNEQLISPSEKLAMFRVVDAMIQTGLKYTQYKVDDGSFVFKLEPPGIENLITFGTESKTIRGRYAVRQLVSREMEREKIRRRRGGNLLLGVTG